MIDGINFISSYFDWIIIGIVAILGICYVIYKLITKKRLGVFSKSYSKELPKEWQLLDIYNVLDEGPFFYNGNIVGAIILLLIKESKLDIRIDETKSGNEKCLAVLSLDDKNDEVTSVSSNDRLTSWLLSNLRRAAQTNGMLSLGDISLWINAMEHKSLKVGLERLCTKLMDHPMQLEEERKVFPLYRYLKAYGEVGEDSDSDLMDRYIVCSPLFNCTPTLLDAMAKRAPAYFVRSEYGKKIYDLLTACPDYLEQWATIMKPVESEEEIDPSDSCNLSSPSSMETYFPIQQLFGKRYVADDNLAINAEGIEIWGGLCRWQNITDCYFVEHQYYTKERVVVEDRERTYLKHHSNLRLAIRAMDYHGKQLSYNYDLETNQSRRSVEELAKAINYYSKKVWIGQRFFDSLNGITDQSFSHADAGNDPATHSQDYYTISNLRKNTLFVDRNGIKIDDDSMKWANIEECYFKLMPGVDYYWRLFVVFTNTNGNKDFMTYRINGKAGWGLTKIGKAINAFSNKEYIDKNFFRLMLLSKIVFVMLCVVITIMLISAIYDKVH